MQDSEKRIIFRFVSAIQIASRVIFSPEESIKIILTHNIMKLNEEEMYNAHPWLLTVPRVGISFYLPYSQTFFYNSLLLSEEKRIFSED